jgi:uncharacterized SAM-binding protein YcdF (DUF218 family)
MLFTLQKLIWYAVLPPGSLILLMTIGLIISSSRRKLGMALVTVGIVLLYLLSLGPVADRLLGPLESYSKPLDKLPVAADAVVVPGGGSVDLAWLGAGPVPNAETYTRLVKGVEIARALHIPLVLSGGNGEPFATRLNDADVMASAACAMGMPKHQVIVENASRNTLENSHAVRRIVAGNRIVLATSGYYMRRAVAMFTRRGFTVIPAPTYQHVQGKKYGIYMLIPSSGALEGSSRALAEWLGMAWWKIRGEM